MSESFDILKKTINTSAIKKVALIDDSFDLPAVDLESLESFILDDKNKAKCKFIDAALWESAVAELAVQEDLSATKIHELLYFEYCKNQDSAYDPSNNFKTHYANQSFVTPLVDLLKSCSLTVKTYGTDVPNDVAHEDLPDLILVDLFFNPTLSPSDLPTTAVGDTAVKTSLEKVEKLIKVEVNNPAIILMSSHGAAAADRASTYRSGIKSKVHASRFGYVDKKHVTPLPKNKWKIEDAARDTFMDIFQTYAFGQALSKALNRWTLSAKSAVEKIENDIHELQLREIAYLVQFRLFEEGQDLEDYLEWFFGEALHDHISTEIDILHEQHSLESSLNIKAVKDIDGAFEPTGAVAKMYHQIRVENKRKRARKHFRLGDLYLNKVRNEVMVVMTPDCDLVLRRNNKRGAAQLLFVPGEITELEGVAVSVGDFIMIGKNAHNIHWEYKRVFTRPFTECFENPGQSDETYEYLGMLRPLYAQEIQANLLNDIGRVGVAVPPIIGTPAIASIEVKTKNGFKPLSEVHSGATFNCSLLHGRASKKPTKVIFGAEAIRQIKETFINIPETVLNAVGVAKLKNVVKEDAKTIVNRLRTGLEPKETLGDGVQLIGDGDFDKSDKGPWALIRISKVRMPSDELKVADAAAAVEPDTVGIVEPAISEEVSIEAKTAAATESHAIIVEAPAEATAVVATQAPIPVQDGNEAHPEIAPALIKPINPSDPPSER